MRQAVQQTGSEYLLNQSKALSNAITNRNKNEETKVSCMKLAESLEQIANEVLLNNPSAEVFENRPYQYNAIFAANAALPNLTAETYLKFVPTKTGFALNS